MSAPIINRIFVYPIKSLDGVELKACDISPGGALLHDREWAIFDDRDVFVNAKRTPAIHKLRTQFNTDFSQAGFHTGDGDTRWFELQEGAGPISDYLSDFFGYPVQLKREMRIGYPDDRDASGPTLLGRETLEAIREWFPPLDSEALWRRFRANIEITGADPFWEDHLYGRDGVAFRMGPVATLGLKPCARCVVPTRDPVTAEIYPSFSKILTGKRRETLPAWADENKFTHYFRMAVNTRIDPAEQGKQVKVGDPIVLT